MKEELGIEEKDWIIYKPTGQVGVVKSVWEINFSKRYKLSLINPSKTLWVEDEKEIDLIIPTG